MTFSNLSMRNKKEIRGFTLVEMLVATAIFMSVMVGAVGALISIIHANDKAQSIKTVVDNVTFSIDSISRNIREGVHYSCIDKNGNLSGANCLGPGIMYMGADNTYTKYMFTSTANVQSGNGNIQKITGCDSSGNNCSTSGWQSITAPTANVNIASMAFSIYGDGVSVQPRVLITVDGFISTGAATTTEFYLQTTASQRIRNE